MDGNMGAGTGARRTVRVLRGVFDKDARRSEEPPVVSPSSPGRTQPREIALPTQEAPARLSRQSRLCQLFNNKQILALEGVDSPSCWKTGRQLTLACITVCQTL